jgi:tetratricopeptide (TPR) repeat protein
MDSGRKLTAQELAELAIFLYQEGDSYQQQGQYYHAKVRFAQSLSVFRKLGVSNETWIAALLYNLGRLSAHEGETKQALAFFEASAYVQQRLGEEESVADLFQKLGRAIAEIGDYALACWLLERAARIYQALGMQEQSSLAQKELSKVTRLTSDLEDAVSPVSHTRRPHEFAIQIDDQAKERFIITINGEVQWSTIKRLDQPLTLGLTSWQVVSIDH